LSGASGSITCQKARTVGFEKFPLCLFYDILEQKDTGPFSTTIHQMLSRPDELRHTLSVNQDLVTTYGRHRLLPDVK
jgi:hypothetical protein